MESFFSLFDPSEGGQSKPKKKNNLEQDNVKKKQDNPKGRRRGRKCAGKGESLPEESSFLCEPHLGTELLMKDTSYIENYIQINKEEDVKVDEKRPKRRNSARKGRRRKNKVSPAKEPEVVGAWGEAGGGGEGGGGGESAAVSWNNRAVLPAPEGTGVHDTIGRNVNDLRGSGTGGSVTREGSGSRGGCSGGSGGRFGDADGTCAADLEREFLCGHDDDDDDGNCSSDDSSSSGSSCESGCGSGAGAGAGRLPPEPRFGNVEYKLRLSGGARRFQHLVTQLKWRLASGGGAAVYVVGVRDGGEVCGAGVRSLRRSLRTLRRMCAALGARPQRLAVRAVSARRAVAEALVRLAPPPRAAPLLRLAALGAAHAGKSTLVGVLTHGELDSGAGSARLNVFRHLHEVRSGLTSSLALEILGFDEQGNVVNYGCSELMTAARIGERSAKLVSILDLAGHAKYQRTTLHGLAGHAPHHAMLVVSASGGVTPMTEQHLWVCCALRLPLLLVLTKCDLASAHQLRRTLQRLAALLQPARMKPVLITDEAMAREYACPQNRLLDKDARDTDRGYVGVCVFPVSCVRGGGLRALTAHLRALPPPLPAPLPTDPMEFHIDEVYWVSECTPVVCGAVRGGGLLRDGARVLVGPAADGGFRRAAVRSLHALREPRAAAPAGHPAGAALRLLTHAREHPPPLRPGMVLLSIPKDYKSCNFQRPVFGACPPGQCPYGHGLVSKLMQEESESVSGTRHKTTNLGGAGPGGTGGTGRNKNTHAHNIYTRSDSDTDEDSGQEGAGGGGVGCEGAWYDEDPLSEQADSEEEGEGEGEKRAWCVCGVPLDDPRDPRGALYFQARVQVVPRSRPVRAGFQCTVHCGGVTQTALVQGILNGAGCVRGGETGCALFRFVRRPEYLVTGRPVLLAAGLATWAVGHITQVFPYIP